MNKIFEFMRIMKISCLLFFSTVCMVFATGSYAHTTKDSFNVSEVNNEVFDMGTILASADNKSSSESLQQLTITGTVLDETGESIPGVTVAVVGATIGALTGLDGEYTINVPSSSTVLRFSFIGYVAQEITVNNQRVINVTLVEESQLLDEVVVIGYGVQRKSSVTGSISQIKAEDLQNRTATSAAGSLQGKTSGIQVVTTFRSSRIQSCYPYQGI